MAENMEKPAAPKPPERWEPFSRFFDWPGWFRPSDLARRFADDEALMRVEELMEGSDMVVRCEIPGVDPAKDVEVTVANGMLRIRAERRQQERKEEGTGPQRRYRSEFHYGSMSRAISLPAGADAENVKATYTDGVLEVRVHVDESRSTKVPITRS